jgi:hypothetical protein
LAVLENLSQAAIGLANGVVILIRGDLSKDKTVKQKVIYEGEEPITGLGFREQTKSTILFIVTTSNIMSYNTTAVKPSVVKKKKKDDVVYSCILNPPPLFIDDSR